MAFAAAPWPPGYMGSSMSYVARPTEKDRRPLLEPVAPYLSEFIGTFVFVFGTRVICGAGSEMWNATAVGCLLTVCVYIFGSNYVEGPATGGHLNPAVSLASLLSGKEGFLKIMWYIVMQLTAGQFAGCLGARFFPDQAPPLGPKPAFAHTSAPHILEFVYTAALCFVVLNVCYSRRNHPVQDQNHFFALAIGFAVVAAGYAGGDISGGCLNPAMALGLGATSDSLGWGDVTFKYIGVQVIGSAAGAVLFRLCRPEEDTLNPYEYENSIHVKMLSELLGTFVLALTVGLCVVCQSDATAWAAAAALMCMIYSLWDVSGAHFNPAVTVAVTMRWPEKCPHNRAFAFVAVQNLAGMLAGFLVATIHWMGPRGSEAYCLGPAERLDSAGNVEYHWMPALVAEFIFTFMLAFTVLAIATVSRPANEAALTRQNFPFGLAIAACVTAGGFAAGGASGGELNPAVSMGLSVSCSVTSGCFRPLWTWFWFAVFEVGGGILAACIFRITHYREFAEKPDA